MSFSFSPFDIMKLCFNKERYLTDQELEGYSQWMMNKILSCHDLFCNAALLLNIPMTDRMHYDCLYHGLPKIDKMYIPYLAKKQAVEKDILNICEFYSVSYNVAKLYLELMSDEEKTQIKNFCEKKGKLK